MNEAARDVLAENLFTRLFADAERVRWSLEAIPWDRIDKARVTPELTALVRDTAQAELTTTTATHRFLSEYSDDTDFTQWISVWFYEETKHPHVLLRWLQAVGVTVDDAFFRRGRVAAPFMRSRVAMLVSNIISEMTAAAGYAGLAERVGEPVLARILRYLAADEGRHAASFYVYTRRYLARSTQLDQDRRDALKVLYLWLDGNVRHPVNTHVTTTESAVIPRERILRLIGELVELPLTESRDVLHHVGAT
ncbi:MAG: ferritin-like domain-containing protein [Kofleriaceae bacterium]